MPSYSLWLLIALVAIVLGLLGVRRARAPKILSPAEFTKQFAARLAPALPGRKVEIKAEKELRITDANGKESTAYLDNAYAEYRQSPQNLSALIQKYLGGLAEFPRADDAIDRSRIVPIIKDRTWITETRQAMIARGAKNPPESVFDDLNDELVIVYAEDNPKSIRYLTPANFAKLGIARGELRSLAVENLKRLLPRIEVIPGPVFSMVKADGNYEASLLLLDELWSGRQVKVDGDVVVAVPARDVLLVSGSQNAAGIAKLRELAAQTVRQSSYRLTRELFVYRQGSFKKLPPQ